MNAPVVRTVALAAAAPCGVVLVVAAVLDLGPAWWSWTPSWTPLSRSAAAGTALALNTLLLLAVCALSVPAPWLGRLFVTVFVAASLASLTAVAGPARTTSFLTGHVVLAASGYMVLAAGTLARRVSRHPLDATGATAALTAVLVAGLLALGPAVPAVPTWVVNLLLRLNPVVAVTAAADIDLLRTGVIYHLSPIPHWMFEYPGWLSSVAAYAAAAAAFAGLSHLRPRVRP